MDRSELQSKPRVEPYEHPTGGWGSVKSLATKSIAEGLAVSTIWNTLFKQNKADGFMCVSCSWAKPADSHAFEFCENGAKATIWEQTKKRTDKDFFARHRVSELLSWTDYELEKNGRLTSPLRYDASLDQYVPVTWESAFAEIGRELQALDPKSTIFYASGRASLETTFMYQLLARIYGHANLPDSSNMCHESTSVGLPLSIGSPVGTIQHEDFEQSDMMLFFGHNTGTNAPRLLHPLQEARKRGVPVYTFNPIEERGLMRFKNPQAPTEMLSPDEGTKMSTDYFQVRCGGDIAAITGIAKAVFALDDAAREAGRERVLDTAFIKEHCHGFEAFERFVRAAEWDEITRVAGLPQGDLEEVGRVYARSKAVMAHYGMGLTQHRHGVENVQMLVNLLLMRGNIGKPGAGISPIRGHSNVQGQRTVGMTEKPELAPLDKFAEFYGFEPPREKGMATVEACEGIIDGSVKAFIGLGGNFSRAVPETAKIEEAWRRLRLHVQISTKLNRNHLLPGEVTYILPCLGRIERDTQATGDQTVSIEDSTACIHGSKGWRPPASPELLSETKIVAELAKATVAGKSTIPWDDWVADYSRVRDEIERCYPQYFKDFNARFLQPGGFHRDLPACRRDWKTESGKANFLLPEDGFDVDPDISVEGHDVFKLMTLRSNDQFNTTVYGYDDRLRGISGSREILLMNKDDMERMGLRDQDFVDVETHADDGVERRVEGLRVHSYKLPKGNVGGYYPELNKLIPLWHHEKQAHVPAAKSVPIRVVRAIPQAVAAE
ncbi:FdhF/YdeP family oxidoreductase [Aureimonas pseudogalii]|uniref:Molybdopterin-dependent oxidoreductase alpha subunit n=1 Tax=Aureimonas pseudogalii TaxID=1744844 RepID=A0A7W6H751_9HYPH|nr:FdhF/YdeP family oxidoreductase [Aureimonas pseudogalii]MBB3999796.1 molybdopterin-dependent oxidoreductase alpha subunit [Aureimonas pseudogalii]